MAAKIEMLGEDTGTAVATVTLYTVPADKSARVQILFAVENSSNQVHYNVLVGTPGSEMNFHAVLAGGIDFWTGTAGQASPNPDNSLQLSSGGAMIKTGIVLATNNNGYDYVIYPFPQDFFLEAGATVRYQIITNSVTDHLIQVMGVEDDA
jgi:hypothetical protein